MGRGWRVMKKRNKLLVVQTKTDAMIVCGRDDSVRTRTKTRDGRLVRSVGGRDHFSAFTDQYFTRWKKVS